MCPACLTAVVLTAGGIGSAGGLVALSIKKIKDRPRPTSPTPTPAQPRTPENTR